MKNFQDSLLSVLVNDNTFLITEKEVTLKHKSLIHFRCYLGLIWTLENIPIYRNGLWLEFGVADGHSINITGNYRIQNSITGNIYGFDSFYGLPNNWKEADMKVGEFSRNGILPPTVSNVQLIQGLFNETLEKFLIEKKAEFSSTRGHNRKRTSKKRSNQLLEQPKQLSVSFVNIDNDLYEGTLFILNKLKPFLKR